MDHLGVAVRQVFLLNLFAGRAVGSVIWATKSLAVRTRPPSIAEDVSGLRWEVTWALTRTPVSGMAAPRCCPSTRQPCQSRGRDAVIGFLDGSSPAFGSNVTKPCDRTRTRCALRRHPVGVITGAPA
ncbi:hypothetical protein SVEN_3819 [Streptomyces venezuelae ATCC 10712]|uniref:Uncharacterized protein n=1 Tax=Streptomyces venezuelae (strain ATCC 10712 / CBS 650.69 / DSM 40230 / JCM 4526 / NBRC 13096 / PD 04745) TaxID=953739 RepID=F2REI2_STRVP|nr:hypothetical protein SVEN_3819 [Streptomyces venezuelae ATCC 10712]